MTCKLYRLRELCEVLGMSRSAIYERLNYKSRYHDPTFPQPIQLSTSRRGAVAWSADEIDRWCESRMALREKNHAPSPHLVDGGARP